MTNAEFNDRRHLKSAGQFVQVFPSASALKHKNDTIAKMSNRRTTGCERRGTIIAAMLNLRNRLA
jgi:hypothetical protein